MLYYHNQVPHKVKSDRRERAQGVRSRPTTVAELKDDHKFFAGSRQEVFCLTACASSEDSQIVGTVDLAGDADSSCCLLLATASSYSRVARQLFAPETSSPDRDESTHSTSPTACTS